MRIALPVAMVAGPTLLVWRATSGIDSIVPRRYIQIKQRVANKIRDVMYLYVAAIEVSNLRWDLPPSHSFRSMTVTFDQIVIFLEVVLCILI